MSLAISKTKLKVLSKALDKLWPLMHADNVWDNTGLLLDVSTQNSTNSKINILLAIDLTIAVAQEAINEKTNVIIAYHPFLFSKFNRITQNNTQQQSLIKLIQHGISVYSPHTAVDAAIGGVNDWLVDGIANKDKLTSKIVIQPSEGAPEGVGCGRLITFNEPITLFKAIERIKLSLKIDYLQYASLDSPEVKLIKTVAICAGSGSGVFKGVEADLYYTGELSHHDALALKEQGKSVIVCNHSNTERGYLEEMKIKLENELGNEFNFVVSKTDKEVFQSI